MEAMSSTGYDPALWERARTAMIEALDAACREQAAGTGRFADGPPDMGIVGYWKP
jgi:hypothetical protein